MIEKLLVIKGDFTPDSDMDIMILLDCNKDEVEMFKKDINRLAIREPCK